MPDRQVFHRGILRAGVDGPGVLASLLKSNGGEIRGRTTIQKLAYFAHCKFPDLDVPPYTPHYYGPFSAGLGQVLANLASLGFVNENVVAGGYAGYAYALSRDGQRLSDDAQNENPKDFDDISRTVSVCKDHCGLDIPVLSAASKIHHLINAGEKMTLKEARAYAEELQWIAKTGNAQKGEFLLRKLNLVA